MATVKKNFKEQIMEKKAMLALVESLMETLNSKEEYYLMEYVETGKEHQRKDWNGNLLWKDANGERTTEETDTPYMEKEYEYVMKETLDDEDKAYQSAIETIRDTLASLDYSTTDTHTPVGGVYEH